MSVSLTGLPSAAMNSCYSCIFATFVSTTLADGGHRGRVRVPYELGFVNEKGVEKVGGAYLGNSHNNAYHRSLDMKKGEGTWLDTSQAGIGNVKPTCSVDPLQHVATEMLQAQGSVLVGYNVEYHKMLAGIYHPIEATIDLEPYIGALFPKSSKESSLEGFCEYHQLADLRSRNSSAFQYANAVLLAKRHLDPLRDLYLGWEEPRQLSKLKECPHCYDAYWSLRREAADLKQKRQGIVQRYGRQEEGSNKNMIHYRRH